MGTRSITYVYNKGIASPKVIAMYRQFDGSPQHHGLQLAAFLSELRLVNGITSYTDKIANGMDCLAAQIVAHFKKGPGNFYLSRPEITAQVCDAEYEYHVYCRNTPNPLPGETVGEIHLKCIEPDTKAVLFDDAVKQFEQWISVAVS